MNDGIDENATDGPGATGPEALYARYAGARHAAARSRHAAARVMASLEGAPDAAAAPVPSDGSPEALYRRYRTVRTADDAAVPAATIDAIMAAVRAESGFAPVAAVEPAIEPGPETESGTGHEPGREPGRGSALGALFRWPGTALDRALGAVGNAVRGAGLPKLVPAMALAVVAVAVVPFVLRDATDPSTGTDAIAFVPPSLLETDGLPPTAYAPDASSGMGFAGGDPLARGYRVGIALTDLVLASRGGESARSLALGALRFESGADADEAVARTIDALADLAVPATEAASLAVAANAVREALAGDDARVAARVDLGRAVESVRVAAVLAVERGATSPLEQALDALAVRDVPDGLAPRAQASLDELVVLAARPSMDASGAADILRIVDRLRLLLG